MHVSHYARKLSVFVTVLLPMSLLLTAGELHESWQKLASQGNALFEAAKFGDASRVFRQALASAESAAAATEELILLRNSLGCSYTAQGQFVWAEDEFREALALERKAHGDETLNYAMMLASIALLPTYQGDKDEAIGKLREALVRASTERREPEFVTAEDYLGKLLYLSHKIQDAESVLLAARAEEGQAPGVASWVRCELANDLGTVRDVQGRWSEAASFYQESLELLEAKLGKADPSLVAPLNNVATIYARMGRLTESLTIFERAEDICLRTLGEKHPTYAELLWNESAVLRKLGRKKESKEMKAESERIQEEANRRNGVGDTVSLSALRDGRE